MQGARALVEVLCQSGVEHIFGLPGDTGMAFYEALNEAQDQITHIMTRDERSASFMADVYARVSGKVGVCEGPSGGGATYIVPGVAEAQGSAIPLICLTSDTPVNQHGRGVLTELDQESLFRPITKWNHRVNSAATMAEMTRRALRMATAARPGAVHLSLPTDSLEGETNDATVYGTPDFLSAPALRMRPDPSLVIRAADAIEQAERPVIVAGGGVMISQAWDALTAFAESLNIPVATSINGKGSIAETSPVSVGIVGGNGARDYTNALVADADLVIFVGSRTDSTTTHHWRIPDMNGPQAVIQIDIEPYEIGNNYKLVAPIAGDARLSLEDLAIAITNPTAIARKHQSRINALVAIRDHYWADVAEQSKNDSSPIKPQRLVRAMREALDDNAIIVADPGTPTPYLGAQYELRRAGRTTVIPRAHGGLGYAIPGSVGAQYAAQANQRVVCMTTDGSFGFSCGEFETVTRLNLPIVYIQCSNNAFGWIKELQHLYHEDQYFGVDFNGIDYATIARGFGLKSWSISDPAKIERTLQEALAFGGPAYINVVTESQITETPPVAAWTDAEERRRLGMRSEHHS